MTECQKKTQFQRTPEGQKTSRMLEVEKRLGRTLEEDFRDYYIERNWGQKRLANRWGVKRHAIFGIRKGKRNWVQMLSLEARTTTPVTAAQPIGSRQCEICGESEVGLDDAHWLARSQGGGTQSWNILKLCPNCHRKLDRDHEATTEAARTVLLYREASKIISKGHVTDGIKKELLAVCRAIISRSHLSKTALKE